MSNTRRRRLHPDSAERDGDFAISTPTKWVARRRRRVCRAIPSPHRAQRQDRSGPGGAESWSCSPLRRAPRRRTVQAHSEPGPPAVRSDCIRPRAEESADQSRPAQCHRDMRGLCMYPRRRNSRSRRGRCSWRPPEPRPPRLGLRRSRKVRRSDGASTRTSAAPSWASRSSAPRCSRREAMASLDGHSSLGNTTTAPSAFLTPAAMTSASTRKGREGRMLGCPVWRRSSALARFMREPVCARPTRDGNDRRAQVELQDWRARVFVTGRRTGWDGVYRLDRWQAQCHPLARAAWL